MSSLLVDILQFSAKTKLKVAINNYEPNQKIHMRMRH